MKRIFSVVLVVLMLCSMFCIYAVAAAPMSLTLDVDAPDGKYERGDLVEVTVGVKDYVGAVLLAIKPVVDTDVLELSLYEGSAEADFTYAAGKIGNPAAVNPATLYTSWVGVRNFTVLENRVPITTFPILTYYFEVPADAPLGETTISVSFMQKDVNGGVSMAAVPSPGVVNELVPGTDYSTEATTLTIEIVCNHDFTDVEYTQPAEGTAMAEAEHSRVCTKCSQTIVETCEFDAVVTDPGHTTTGYTTHTCACGYVVVDTETEATGHEWGEYVHDAELTEGEHTHTRTCVANDGGSETEKCSFTTKYTDPTCTEDGYVTYTCEVCNYSYDVTDVGSAKGHDLTDYDYYGEVAGVHTHIAGCTACDYEEEVACEMGAWSVTEEPTREKTGLKTRTCIYCKEGSESEVLPKVAYFTVSDAEGVCGHELEVSVSITNNPGLSGVIFEVAFDDTQMELIGAEIGALGANVPVTIQPANKDGEVYKIALATSAGVVGDGELLKLKFKVADTVTEGEHEITVSTNDACDSSDAMADFVIESDAGIADLRNYILGDVNRDGKVSIADAVQLARFVADVEVTIDPYAAELVTDDDGISVADVQYLLQALIGIYTL